MYQSTGGARRKASVPRLAETDRSVVLQGAFNVRDLGGLPTRNQTRTIRGMVYRADSLDSLTSSDEEVLFCNLGIGTIIDLRTPEEAGGDGFSDARRFPKARVCSYPVIPDGRIGTEPFPVGKPEAVAQLYMTYVVERGAIVANVIDAIAESLESETPALFHCAAGRDRTGVVAAVLLSLLGVSEWAIVADYMDSNRKADEVSRRLMLNPIYRVDNAAQGEIAPVDQRTIQQFLKLFGAAFRSARSWAATSGLALKRVDNLARLLADGR